MRPGLYLLSKSEALNPVVTNAVPTHDARVVSSYVTDHLLSVKRMNEASVEDRFRFDGQSVATNALTWTPASRSCLFDFVGEGVHTAEVLTNR